VQLGYLVPGFGEEEDAAAKMGDPDPDTDTLLALRQIRQM
jgi:hypothetical protein